MAAEGSLQHVTAEEAIELANEGALLIDVREQWEWDRGHAPNAVLMPMSSFADYVDELPTDADILVICHSGSRSLSVTEYLLQEGRDAVNLTGGMIAWFSAGGEIDVD